MSRRKSVAWGFFRTVDESSIQCLLCQDIQSRYVQGSTTAMWRHLRTKHPKDIAKKSKGRTSGAAVNVDVLLEDEDPDIHTTVDESDISDINGSLESVPLEDSAELIQDGKTSDNHSVRQGRKQRSLIWRHFERLDSLKSARCRICMRKLQCVEGGSTCNLRRHMSKRHPQVFAKLVPGRLKPSPTSSSQDIIANGDIVTTAEVIGPIEQRQISVDMLLEDEDPDIHTTVDESNISDINGNLESAPLEDPAELIGDRKTSDNHSVRQGRTQWSLIWRHFERLDSLKSARCRICMRELQCSEGSTGNLHRHMSKKHPEVFAKLVPGRLKPSPTSSSQDIIANGDMVTTAEVAGSTEQRQISVYMLSEDEDPDIHTTVDESNISDRNGNLESAPLEDPAELKQDRKTSDNHSVRQSRTQRSLIWRHFERLDSLKAARCRICMKKLQCSEGSTSNLHRHMSKRHPDLFAKLVLGGLNPPPTSSSQDFTANGDTVTTGKAIGPTGVVKVIRPFLPQNHILKRERELIEALRRTQKEEARALEHQRELLEKLRTVNAREAAAEREEIESLRKAQQEEAKELNAQREALQREKAELQNKWEELQMSL